MFDWGYIVAVFDSYEPELTAAEKNRMELFAKIEPERPHMSSLRHRLAEGLVKLANTLDSGVQATPAR